MNYWMQSVPQISDNLRYGYKAHDYYWQCPIMCFQKDIEKSIDLLFALSLSKVAPIFLYSFIP